MLILYLPVCIILVAFVCAGIRQALFYNRTSEIEEKDKWFVIDKDVWAICGITAIFGTLISVGIWLIVSAGSNFFFKEYETDYVRELQRVESTYVVAEGDYYRFYGKADDGVSDTFLVSKTNIRIVVDDTPRVKKEIVVRPAIVDHLLLDMTDPRYVLYVPEGSIHRIIEEK